MSNPFWPVYLQQHYPDHASLALSGVGIYILPMLGMMLTSVWWGRMGDRYGHQWMMIRALLGLSLTQCLLAFSTSPLEILLLRFMQGALAGFIAPAQAYAAGLVQRDKPFKLFAALQVATNIGAFAGAVAGGAIWDTFSFVWINLCASALCAVCAVFTWLALPPLAKQADHATQQPSTPAKAADAGNATATANTPDLPLIMLMSLMVVLGILIAARMVLQVPFSLYVSTELGLDKTTTGLMYGLMSLGFCLFASWWARYFEQADTAAVLRRQLWLILALASTATYLGMIEQHVVAFALGQLIWGILIAGSTPVLTALVARSIAQAQRGKFLGWTQSITQGCSAIGIAAGGVVVHLDALAVVYHIVTTVYVIGFLGLLLVYLLWRRPHFTSSSRP